MPALRVLFVVPQGSLAPGPRYRVYQYLPRLQALGVEPVVLVVRPERSTVRLLTGSSQNQLRRVAHLARSWLQNQSAFVRITRLAPQFDRVFVYKCPVPSWALPALAPCRERLLYDFDDALDQAELEGGLLQHWRTRVLRRGMENAVAAARLTITSNTRNAAVVRQMGGRVVVIPTCVDLAQAILRDRRRLTAPAPVLGWTGTPSTARYLASIEKPLSVLVGRRPVAVCLIGAGRSPFAGLRADVRPWSLATEPQDVSAFDVGLMPMPDTPWTRGKAALKALLYGASGMASVASWTPTNAEILGEHNGSVLCHSEADWLAAFERVLSDDDWRSEMGARARRRVESSYSLDRMVPRLMSAITGFSETPVGEGLRVGLSAANHMR
jgi:glycosyltransferase involved in cell wall biosynthesis